MSKYVLETHHHRIQDGINKHEQLIQDFDTRKEVDKYIMLYKLSENIGYTLYKMSYSDYWSDYDNRYNYIEEQWFDRAAYRGVYNATRSTKKN